MSRKTEIEKALRRAAHCDPTCMQYFIGKAVVLSIMDLTDAVNRHVPPILSEDEVVLIAHACPRCEENRYDYLENIEGKVTCISCGHRYEPEKKE